MMEMPNSILKEEGKPPTIFEVQEEVSTAWSCDLEEENGLDLVNQFRGQQRLDGHQQVTWGDARTGRGWKGKEKVIAHISQETAFALGTQRDQKGDKQHEIDMPNSYPMRTIFHQLALGLA